MKFEGMAISYFLVIAVVPSAQKEAQIFFLQVSREEIMAPCADIINMKLFQGSR
jgi:hypothetical protein